MNVRKYLVSPLLCAGALAATAAQAQQVKQCVPAPEAEALVLNVAPQLLTTVATSCAPALPGTAYLRRPVAQLTEKYVAESDRAWPLAKEALKKISGPDAAQIWDSELSRPMVGSIVGPMLAKEIKTADCPAIDRVLTLSDPLPARNTASLIVLVLELAGRDKPTKNGFSICPTTARAAQ